MARLTSQDFQPEVMQLFDRYVHGDISRRSFLQSAAAYTGSMSAATAVLGALSPQFAQAQVIAPTDERIQTKTLTLDSPRGSGTVSGLLAWPANADGPLPTVLVVHENRGLNPHIEDIARRLAVEGYLAFAPDALASLGGYPGDEDKARELFAKLDQKLIQQDWIVAAQSLKALEPSNGKVGVVGFCYGGGMSNFLATQVPNLAAAVPFYGPAPALADVPQIKAPLLLHFAENDDRVNATWPPYESALKDAGVNYEAYVYAGTQHGFNNDTTPRFDAAAAALAWNRTLEFFKAHLAF